MPTDTISRVSYAQRKPYALPDTLAELTGPPTGELTLPLHMSWSGQRTYSLQDSHQVTILYEQIITEAASQADLASLLNHSLLKRVWPQLYLPQPIHDLWESRFPELTRHHGEG